MKNLISRNNFFLFAFMFMSSFVFGQGSFDGSGDGTTTSSFHVVLEDVGSGQAICGDGMVAYEIKVSLTNLLCDCSGDPSLSCISCNKYRVLEYPRSEVTYPSIYVQYTINGNSVDPILITLDDFHLVENHGHDHTSIGYSDPDVDHGNHLLFQASILTTPLAIDCNAYEIPLKIQLLTKIEGNGNSSSFGFVFGNGTYLPYPIEQFTDPGNIFDCIVFNDLDCDSCAMQNCNILLESDVRLCCPDSNPPKTEAYEGHSQSHVGHLQAHGHEHEHGHAHGHSHHEANLSMDANPNPFSETFNVEYQLMHAATVEIQLFDMKGKVVYQDRMNKRAGAFRHRVATDALSSGIYYLKLNTDSETKVLKLIKL